MISKLLHHKYNSKDFLNNSWCDNYNLKFFVAFMTVAAFIWFKMWSFPEKLQKKMFRDYSRYLLSLNLNDLVCFMPMQRQRSRSRAVVCRDQELCIGNSTHYYLFALLCPAVLLFKDTDELLSSMQTCLSVETRSFVLISSLTQR